MHDLEKVQYIDDFIEPIILTPNKENNSSDQDISSCDIENANM